MHHPYGYGDTAGTIVPVSAITEQDLFDRLRTSLRQAIQYCKDLANFPAQGPTYLKMREELETLETASRQVGYWREDARWFAFGFEMASFHQRLGDAIRHHMARTVFLHMAKMMEGALAEADKLRTAKTGRRGPILPKPKPGPHRESRPVYIKRPSGLLLPA